MATWKRIAERAEMHSKLLQSRINFLEANRFVAQKMIRDLRDDDGTHCCPCHVDENEFECTCHKYDEIIDYLNKKPK